MTPAQFQKQIWGNYHKRGRDFSWRRTQNPYLILVSEVMLQQTQTSRVEQKFKEFIKIFPTAQDLAKAPLSAVLSIWQGLGYNRRAMYLQKTASILVEKFHGELPRDPVQLKTLPGIGVNTVGSIMAFAFNLPVVFIETNIRRVFIHFFFAEKEEVDDKDILLLVEKTLDRKNPREWYFALMDYGAMLSKTVLNPNRRSRQHVIQSKFNGSNRQVRGVILRVLLQGSRRLEDLAKESNRSKEVVKKVLVDLKQEGFVALSKKGWKLVS